MTYDFWILLFILLMFGQFLAQMDSLRRNKYTLPLLFTIIANQFNAYSVL